LRISGWSGLAAGAALLATGGTFGLLASREKSRVDGASVGTPWSVLEPRTHRFDSYRTVAYYCAGLGAGLAVSGGVLLALSYRRSFVPERTPDAATPRLSAMPAVGPQQVGVVLAGSF
jgi:hypothetical protein